MELLVLSESLNYVAAEFINIHPSAFHPPGLRRPQELDQSIVVQLLCYSVVLGKVHDHYMALGVQLRRGCVPAIRFRRVDPRL
jgi:hypothetical protein